MLISRRTLLKGGCYTFLFSGQSAAAGAYSNSNAKSPIIFHPDDKFYGVAAGANSSEVAICFVFTGPAIFDTNSRAINKKLEIPQLPSHIHEHYCIGGVPIGYLWYGVEWSNDGSIIAAVRNKTTYIFSAATGKVICAKDSPTRNEVNEHGVRTQESLSGLSLSSSGKYAVTANMWGAYVWESNTENDLYSYKNFPSQVVDTTWSPDDKFIAAFGCIPGNKRSHTQLHIWAAQTGDLVHKLDVSGAAITAYAWCPDGKHIVIRNKKGLGLYEFAAYDKGPIVQFKYLREPFAVSPDGKHIAFCPQTGVLEIFDLFSGKRMTRISHDFGKELEQDCHFTGLYWQQDGTTIMQAYPNVAILIWNVPAL